MLDGMDNHKSPVVALYFDALDLGDWAWRDYMDGKIGLSGTQKRNLFIPCALAQKGSSVLFMTNNIPSDAIPNIRQYQVKDFADALGRLRSLKHDVLIFSNREDAQTHIGLDVLSEGWSCPVIMSVGNGPSPAICRKVCKIQNLTVVCVSHVQADGLRDQSRQFFNKVQVVYAGGIASIANDLPEYWASKDPFRVCYVGSIVPEKGFHLLAKVWPAIREQCSCARLSVIGSARLYSRSYPLGAMGIAEEAYETELIRYFGPDPTQCGVRFHGLVAPSDYHRIVDRCSIGVVNPQWKGAIETFCNSAVELQSRGLAVVGGNAGGLRETVWNGKSGILVSSEQQLKNAILRLLRNPKTARKMGRNALIHASTFSSQGVVQSWESLIGAVIRGETLSVPPFSIRRADARVLLRESIRLLRLVPGCDRYIPTLAQVRLKCCKS